MKALKVLSAAAVAAVLTLSAGIAVSAATDSGAAPLTQNETAIVPVEELQVRAEVESADCYEGEPFSISMQASGGGSSYMYSCSVSDSSGKTVYTTQSADSRLTLTLNEGTYTVSVEVTDDLQQSASDKVQVTVKKREPLEDAGTNLSKTVINAGDKVTVNASFTGGKDPYTYQYSYINKSTGSRSCTSFISENTYTYTMPKAPGYYTFYVTAKDALGQMKKVSMDAAVVQKTGAELSLTGSSINKTTVSPGGTVAASAAAAGGTAPYKYLFSYKGPDGKWVNTDADYITMKSKSISLPKVSGKYTVRIAVKDHAGKYAEKLFNVEIPAFSISDSQISASSVDVNKPLTLTTKINNNVGSVKYHYSYHYEGKAWIYTSDYISSDTFQFKFSTPGTVYVRVGAKDSLGTYKEKQFKIIVKLPVPMDVSSSTVTGTLVPVGKNIRINSIVSNANGDVKYHYSYHAEGKPWIYLGDYTTASVKNFCFKWQNVYYIRVGVKDASGQYKEKQFRVCVYSNSVKKTVSSTTMQYGANWKSGSVLSLKSGSVVNPIKTYGKWILVRYNNRTGYVYNLAFGGTRNYSSISTSALPAIADDIIFARGKSVYSLYHYVNSMGYVSAHNSTLENLCVYILRYRRGACYHRAALLYYLLDRAGYEVVRVSDGIDRYTGGDPHNWCIIKTSQGWRHIDPTPIIGVRPIYLETDARVSTLFSWDRKKYPKCN